MEEDVDFLKRYKLLITLVVILLIMGVGCWLVKNRDGNKSDIRKGEVLQHLNLRRK